MLRRSAVLLVAAMMVAAAAACAPDPQVTGQPAATGAVTGESPSSSRPGSPPAARSSSPAPRASGTAGTGIAGQTVMVTCPVDRGDPPCPVTPVQARLSVSNAATQAVVATVDTDAQGQFSVVVPAGAYVLRPVLIAGGPARRPVSLPVTVTAGQYTMITMRLDNGLR